MAKKFNAREFKILHDNQSVDSLANHARWVTDYISTGTNQILARSSTFIGFLSIEISFIANWDPKNFERVPHFRWFFTFGLAAAITSVFFLLWASKVKYFTYPDFGEIEDGIEHKKVSASITILNAFLQENNNRNLYDELSEENAHVSRFFGIGMKFLFASQIIFASELALRWIYFK